MTIYLLAVLVLGLMCGSELNVGAFAHRALNRQPLETHILMRAALARLFGRLMPFWMSGSALLNILLLLPFSHLGFETWRLAALSAAIQVLAIIFSLVGPVPINNRIVKWTPQTLPDDWKAQERRWDVYHLERTCGLIVAFAALTLGAMLR
jgi:uncharacterized membrane protein